VTHNSQLLSHGESDGAQILLFFAVGDEVGGHMLACWSVVSGAHLDGEEFAMWSACC
jgi:hypothetical protein